MSKPANATEALRECPREPTEAMLDAACEHDNAAKRFGYPGEYEGIWKAMYDAAPVLEPPKEDANSMGHAVTQVLNAAQSLPEHLRRDYFTGLATIAISIMHGTYGRKFTAGFLHDATQSLDDPITVAFREPSKQ